MKDWINILFEEHFRRIGDEIVLDLSLFSRRLIDKAFENYETL